MNDTYIVTVYVMIDDLLAIMNHQDDSRARLSAAEILTVAVLSAKYFQNHHERALGILSRLGYIESFSVSRFNRRLHKLLTLFWHLTRLVGELFNRQTVFVVDATPIPACKNVRRDRCRKVQGDDYAGYCASKKEYFFGWHLHLVCDADGIPITFELLPARWDELVPIQHLLAPLPAGSQVVADKGYISYKDQLAAFLHGEIRLIPKHRRNIRANSPADAKLIAAHRRMIETVNGQLEKMGIQRLHARTKTGIALKILASLLALAFTNFSV